ncbi:MAG: hypothetical protein LBK63_02680, partial [Treponema sp.]|nr:hypothetical protein [Treponema sp.]
MDFRVDTLGFAFTGLLTGHFDPVRGGGGGGKIKTPLDKKHGSIVVFMENLYKAARCLIENVTEKCPCLKLKRLPKWYNSLYYDKLSEGLIPD